MFDAQRPVIIFGSGVRLAGAEKEALEFAELTGIPVSPTWGGLDSYLMTILSLLAVMEPTARDMAISLWPIAILFLLSDVD